MVVSLCLGSESKPHHLPGGRHRAAQSSHLRERSCVGLNTHLTSTAAKLKVSQVDEYERDGEDAEVATKRWSARANLVIKTLAGATVKRSRNVLRNETKPWLVLLFL
jgi:hypothetical protein